MTTITRIITADDRTASNRLKSLYNQKKHALDLTQVKIAKRCGWTQGFISQCMTCRVAMNMQTIVKWSALLNVDPHEIDPNFSKRFPRLQKVQIPIKNDHDNFVGMTERVIDRAEYAFKLPTDLGFIPRGTIAHVDPDKPVEVNTFVVCKFIDSGHIVFGKIKAIQKTQLKLDIFSSVVVLPFTDLAHYHRVISLTLP